MENSLPLHVCRVKKSSLVINRFHFFLHGTALIALICYRAYTLLEMTQSKNIQLKLCYSLVFTSELILSFLWLLDQPYRWRPVYRTVFPGRLPGDDKLPTVDVFICTADPNKEPSVGVMNTVISAMALDYPPYKLHIYLSDDGGSSVTLGALREAWKFSCFWLPFCRKYGIKTRCPEAYFSGENELCVGNLSSTSSEFIDERQKIEKKYEEFKKRVQWIKEQKCSNTNNNYPASIEVIKGVNDDRMETDELHMPLVVYVAREKRPSHPHHFKAGALNVLLRVSSMFSNSPYILVLDCDMYCNDSSSARQAMCFHLDSKKSPRLAFVQFPQKFHNISDKDIYDNQIRSIFTIGWPGVDGLQGPVVSGTGFYITRDALYDTSSMAVDVSKLREKFGPSNEFIKSLHQKNAINVEKTKEYSNTLHKEIQFLASCTYENNTQWGKEVGFRYFSVLEDYFTGMSLHSKGWISVYCDPPKPAFLGSSTTSLSDALVQHTRWCSGLAEVAISKYSPLIYCPPRMSILQSMYYAELAYLPFYCLPLWCLAIVPQLCLLHGIPLYPGISNQFFILFAFIFLSSNLKQIQEVLSVGHSVRTWIYEQRMWMIKSVTCYTHGCLNAIMEKIGIIEASFLPTSKVVDEGQLELYKSGVYDFQAPTMFIAPMCTLVILNIASLLLGAVKMFRTKNYDEMFIQASIPFFIVVMQYPVIEGMVFRKDNGRVPQSSALLSALLSAVILALGSFFFTN